MIFSALMVEVRRFSPRAWRASRSLRCRFRQQPYERLWVVVLPSAGAGLRLGEKEKTSHGVGSIEPRTSTGNAPDAAKTNIAWPAVMLPVEDQDPHAAVRACPRPK